MPSTNVSAGQVMRLITANLTVSSLLGLCSGITCVHCAGPEARRAISLLGILSCELAHLEGAVRRLLFQGHPPNRQVGIQLSTLQGSDHSQTTFK